MLHLGLAIQLERSVGRERVRLGQIALERTGQPGVGAAGLEAVAVTVQLSCRRAIAQLPSNLWHNG